MAECMNIVGCFQFFLLNTENSDPQHTLHAMHLMQQTHNTHRNQSLYVPESIANEILYREKRRSMLAMTIWI